jgi:hypothetical protein
VSALRGDLDRAALLAGVAAAHPNRRRHEDEDRIWHRLSDELLGPARERLGADAWERAERRGGAMRLRDVVALVQRRDAAAV